MICWSNKQRKAFTRVSWLLLQFITFFYLIYRSPEDMADDSELRYAYVVTGPSEGGKKSVVGMLPHQKCTEWPKTVRLYVAMIEKRTVTKV